VAHLFSRVDAWADAWQLSAEARRGLLKNFSAVLQAEGDKALSVKALIKYIQSFKAETGSYPAEVEAQVAQALVNAVNSPVDAFADRVALLGVSILCVCVADVGSDSSRLKFWDRRNVPVSNLCSS
jgi:hypothetical protein